MLQPTHARHVLLRETASQAPARQHTHLGRVGWATWHGFTGAVTVLAELIRRGDRWSWNTTQSITHRCVVLAYTDNEDGFAATIRLG